MSYVSTKDLHVEEFKVRLTEQDAELLRALARRAGMPAAVLMRTWARSQLDQVQRKNIAA